MLDSVAVKFEHPTEDIFKNIGTQITDVRVIVHGRAAGIDANFGGTERFKVTHLT
jgi:hypothetical protein